MSVAFIDQNRDTYGVEPICQVLPIAPSTFFRHKLLQRDPSRRSVRAQDDDVLRAIIRRIWNDTPSGVRTAKGVATNGPRASARGALSRSSVDAGPGPRWRGPWPGVDDHDPVGVDR